MGKSLIVVRGENAPQNLGPNKGIRICDAEHTLQIRLAKLPVFESGSEFENVETFLTAQLRLRSWTKSF